MTFLSKLFSRNKPHSDIRFALINRAIRECVEENPTIFDGKYTQIILVNVYNIIHHKYTRYHANVDNSKRIPVLSKPTLLYIDCVLYTEDECVAVFKDIIYEEVTTYMDMINNIDS